MLLEKFFCLLGSIQVLDGREWCKEGKREGTVLHESKTDDVSFYILISSWGWMVAYLIRQADQHEGVPWPDMQMVLVDLELCVVVIVLLDLVWRHVQFDIRMLDEGLRKVDTEHRV